MKIILIINKKGIEIILTINYLPIESISQTAVKYSLKL